MVKRTVDSPQPRGSYIQPNGAVEPVLANIRNNKQLNRFILRGKCKGNAQRHLYRMVQNIEKIAHYG